MNRSGIISVIFVVLLSAHSVPSMAKWVAGDHNDDVEWQFDSVRIRKESDYITAWILVNFRTSFESIENREVIQAFPELRTVKSLIRQVKVRCNSHEEATQNVTYYNGPNGNGAVLKSISVAALQVPLTFDAYPPNSVGEVTLVKLCRHAGSILRSR
jgi:hypothetical protein